MKMRRGHCGLWGIWDRLSLWYVETTGGTNDRNGTLGTTSKYTNVLSIPTRCTIWSVGTGRLGALLVEWVGPLLMNRNFSYHDVNVK